MEELIQLVSEESSFFNHIITAERPPGLSLGAVQGSAKAEAALCLGSEQTNDWSSQSLENRQTHWSHQSIWCKQHRGLKFTLSLSWYETRELTFEALQVILEAEETVGTPEILKGDDRKLHTEEKDLCLDSTLKGPYRWILML